MTTNALYASITPSIKERIINGIKNKHLVLESPKVDSNILDIMNSLFCLENTKYYENGCYLFIQNTSECLRYTRFKFTDRRENDYTYRMLIRQTDPMTGQVELWI